MSGNVINKDLEHMQHRPMAWNQQTEAYTYWRERDDCGWNGRVANPQRSETNISFNTPDIYKKFELMLMRRVKAYRSSGSVV